MSSENTPLLNDANDHEAVYNRFSTRQKKWIVALVSWSGLIPLFVSGSFVPSIPDIARELDSSANIISLAVSFSVFALAVGSLTCATYSNFYGRRPIYLCSLPVLVIGSLGVSLSQNVTQLLSWRFLQSLGASGGMPVGSAVISDIYKLEERGTAMGIYFAAVLMGPALAPLTGGLAAHYSSWRVMQLALALSSLLSFTLMAACLPETSHPNTLGVDKLELQNEGSDTQHRWKWVWLNPIGSLWLLRSPNLMAVTLAGTAVMLTDYVLLIPIAQTIGRRYGITNEAIIGACFLPAGLGNAIGAPVAGRLSDKTIIKWRRRRGGVWIPEDRLRATLVGALVFVPLSVLGSGLCVHYIAGLPGFILNLVFLFMNGFGVDLVLSPSAAYSVDVLHSRSAEVMAANNAFRSVILSAVIAGILPSINSVGVLATNALAALSVWIGFGLLWSTIRYGDRMRAWVDVGYSTLQDN